MIRPGGVESSAVDARVRAGQHLEAGQRQRTSRRPERDCPNCQRPFLGLPWSLSCWWASARLLWDCAQMVQTKAPCAGRLNAHERSYRSATFNHAMMTG